MRWQGAGGSAVHATQRDVTASLTGRGRPIEETVARVLAATKAMAIADPRCANWNWAKEEEDIRRLCYGFVSKVMREDGEDLGHTLPDKLYDAWNQMIAQGYIPEVSHNVHGAHVRRSKRNHTKSGADGETGGAAGGTQERSSDDDGPERPKIGPRPFHRINVKTLPRRQWFYGRHYMRKIVSATVAPGGTGKSNLSLVEGISQSIGRDLIYGEAIGRYRVWYHNAEDPPAALISNP
jgi:AAA domain